MVRVVGDGSVRSALAALIVISMAVTGWSAAMVAVGAGSSHSRILIEGDDDFTYANGVVSGSGTYNDPYIISGWTIDAMWDSAIAVIDTTKHFVIRDVSLYSSYWPDDGVGISIRGASNGTVSDSRLSELFWGIIVQNSENITIQACELRNMTQCGIHSYSYEGETRGLTIRNCTIVGCEVESEYGGVWMNFGMDLTFSEDITIAGNHINETLRAIEIQACTGVSCSNNSLTFNREDGLAIWSCSGVLVTDNEMIANSVSGLSFDGCEYMTVTRNYVAGNNYGLYGGASYSVVYHNDFVGNSQNAYPHVVDECSWDSGYPGGGNYWSDYTGVDEFSGPDQDIAGPDGIGDSPYDINFITDFEDRYPLMAPCLGPLNEAPVAMIDISPSAGTNSTIFTFDASGSHDAEDQTSDLSVRWDIGYDGIWDVNWTSEKTFTRTFQEPGTYLVHLQVRDTGLLIDDDDASFTVYEGDPPSTTAVLTGTEGEDGWYVSAVAVDLEVTGAQGVAVTEFNLDLSGWTVYEDTIEVEDDGTHTLQFYSIDEREVAEEVKTVEVKLDSTAPEVDIETLNGTEFDTGDVNITWTCSDACSGIGSCEYSLDGAPFTSCTASSVIMLEGLEDGTHDLTIRVHDEAGNNVSAQVMFEVETASDDYIIDPYGVDPGAYWPMIVLIVVVASAVVAGAALYMTRRRRGA